MGTVRRLRPIRVLLASRDPRFLGVSAFLLSRNGFVIDTTRRLGQLLDLIDRRPANVVVLDGTGSPGAAARTAAIIEALYPRVGVVVVAEEADAATALESRPLAKWSSFGKIVSEIERVYARVGLNEKLGPLVQLERQQLRAH